MTGKQPENLHVENLPIICVNQLIFVIADMHSQMLPLVDVPYSYALFQIFRKRTSGARWLTSESCQESIARRIRNISANTIRLYILFTDTSFLPLLGVGNSDIGITRQRYVRGKEVQRTKNMP